MANISFPCKKNCLPHTTGEWDTERSQRASSEYLFECALDVDQTHALLGERARYFVDEHDTAEAAFAHGRVALVGALDERHVVVHEQPVDIDALELRSLARQAEVQAIARIVFDDEQHARLIRATNQSNLRRRCFCCCLLTK